MTMSEENYKTDRKRGIFVRLSSAGRPNGSRLEILEG